MSTYNRKYSVESIQRKKNAQKLKEVKKLYMPSKYAKFVNLGQILFKIKQQKKIDGQSVTHKDR